MGHKVQTRVVNEKSERVKADPEVTLIPSAKQGHSLLIGEMLNNQVKTYIRSVWDSGGRITSEPHTSEKDVCDCPSTEIYNQMRKIVQ